MNVQPVTLAELKSRQAEYALKAEKLRVERNATSNTSKLAWSIAKSIKMWQDRADDYARLILAVEHISDGLITGINEVTKRYPGKERGSSPVQPSTTTTQEKQ